MVPGFGVKCDYLVVSSETGCKEEDGCVVRCNCISLLSLYMQVTKSISKARICDVM